jgi:protein-S-isoprenylcysteine O-methyltransferase Ste14
VRNPIRVKNLAVRFLPVYALGAVLLFTARPGWGEYVAGLLSMAAGAWLRSWGAGHLVKSAHLTITGPYALLRHPLYLGTLLAGIGISLLPGGIAAAALLAVFVPWFFLSYFPRKERSESARLESLHGEVFERYRAEVPALLPRRSPWKPPASAPALAGGDGRWSFARYSENNELGTLLGLAACAVAFGVRTAIVQSGA